MYLKVSDKIGILRIYTLYKHRDTLNTLVVERLCCSHCLWGSVFGPCFYAMLSVLSFFFCNHLHYEERTGCFTFIVFLMSCD